jgi:threonine dehydrogenase-like Zn-dependent dehydrogenase
VELVKYGHSSLSLGTGLNGCYASHIVLRSGTHLVEVPDGVSDRVASPANCALATMFAALENLPNSCRSVVIQGAGLLGLYGAILLRTRGVPNVYVVDPSASRLDRVRDFLGVPMGADDLRPLYGQIDVVIEAAGTASVIPEGLRLLRPGGHYILVGMVHPDSEFAITGEALIRGCITMRGVHNYGPRHLEQAIAFLEQEPSLPWESLISPAYPLLELNQAFAIAASRTWPRVAVKLSG